MNQSIIKYVIGKVMTIVGALMLLPIVTGIIYQEKEAFAYVIVGAASFLAGQLLSRKKPKNTMFYLKEGCVVTALTWILISIIGAIPFVLTGEIPNFIDAMFETSSGFTTTGSSILKNVEALSHTSLIWRSFTHWVGGMGVLVFLLAVIPMSGGSNINLMKAESPGPSVGKLAPKIRNSASILYKIYLGMTVLEIVLLLIAKMPLFDTLCISFGSAGTGGFGVRNDSCGSYTGLQQWITGIFCALFGVNFNFYYYILDREPKKSFKMEEVRTYFCIIFASTFLIFFNILPRFNTVESALRASFFQVSSIITTTGFSSVDFNLWPSFSKVILVALMFVGACAGSTGGGYKVSRLVIAIKTVIKEANSYIHPKSVKKIKMDGECVEHDVLRSINVYTITYLVIFVVSVLLVSIEGKDLVTTFTAVAATYNNIGPGLAAVGPSANFADLSYFSKIVLIFDMLSGRLELFPMLILFHPAVLKDVFLKKKALKATK
ncbi:MAG: TrkH family potassium uptake protein [Lachnospiraceae bacterium]|uniref:TrkH family potassium uptake protein n=1 Tax=Candidatus Weimeria bifida TaxID=2599074 RepID=A0A6N7J0A1_9FIRM|nr:TrkH family potassium uptake protein [Candidatus Weimeria bifida]RRF94686.1 MAG: TrkH family potassium uptake protein [Lachnospiraceae bacterium]